MTADQRGPARAIEAVRVAAFLSKLGLLLYDAAPRSYGFRVTTLSQGHERDGRRPNESPEPRKLTLSKETLRTLGDDELTGVAGGGGHRHAYGHDKVSFKCTGVCIVSDGCSGGCVNSTGICR